MGLTSSPDTGPVLVTVTCAARVEPNPLTASMATALPPQPRGNFVGAPIGALRLKVV